MNYRKFIADQVDALRREVGSGIAINALSGGVDSSVVTVLAHRALGSQLKTIFVENALMREGEPQRHHADVKKVCVLKEMIIRIAWRRDSFKALSTERVSLNLSSLSRRSLMILTAMGIVRNSRANVML